MESSILNSNKKQNMLRQSVDFFLPKISKASRLTAADRQQNQILSFGQSSALYVS